MANTSMGETAAQKGKVAEAPKLRSPLSDKAHRVCKSGAIPTGTNPKKSGTKKSASAIPDTGKKATRENGSGDAAPQSGKGSIKSVKRAKKAERAPSIWNQVVSQTSSITGFTISKKSKRPSVLVRATERTRQIKVRQEAAAARDKKVEKTVPGVILNKIKPAVVKKDECMQPFRACDLPKELRTQIWRDAVVYPDCFVWPTGQTGKDQPDLAMTCRGVREEALKAYYRENIFAINVEPQATGELKKISKWATALSKNEDTNWFDEIRKWAFAYTPPFAPRIWRAGEDDGGLIVFVGFHKKDAYGWSANIEIHRDARCLLPSSETCGNCVVALNPDWLNKAVVEATMAANENGMRAKIVLELADVIRKNVYELVDVRCVDGFAMWM